MEIVQDASGTTPVATVSQITSGRATKEKMTIKRPTVDPDATLREDFDGLVQANPLTAQVALLCLILCGGMSAVIGAMISLAGTEELYLQVKDMIDDSTNHSHKRK